MKKFFRAIRRWSSALNSRGGNVPDGSRYRVRRALEETRRENQALYRAVADPDKIVWVPPGVIRFKLRRNSIIGLRLNEIQSGDWDLERRALEETAKFNSVIQHFRDGLDWERTDIFRRYATRLGQGEIIRGCSTIAELKNVYRADMDKLYAGLSASGFLLPQDRAKRKSDLAHIYVGRDGEIIFGSNGNHRLAMARLLNLSRIACSVLGRHAEWQALRENLISQDAGSRREYLGPALVDHPDLQDLLTLGAGLEGNP